MKCDLFFDILYIPYDLQKALEAMKKYNQIINNGSNSEIDK